MANNWATTLAPAGDLPALFDVAINGVGYMVAWEIDRELLSPWKVAYEEDCVDLLIERTDVNTGEITENKMDETWWVANRSWDYGAGQIRFDPTVTSYPPDRAFYDSSGVDVFSTLGQATLLPSVANILALTNLSPNAPQKMVATSNGVYVAGPQPNVYHFTTANASDVVAVASGTSTAQPILDMATDGTFVYLALGPDGVTENVGTTYTQVEPLNATTGFTTGSGVTLAADNTDFYNGGASLTMVTTSGGPNNAFKTVAGAPVNYSADSLFTIWHKQTAPGSHSFVANGTYVVPAGVTSINVSALGGVGTGGAPGLGAGVVATIPVTPGRTLTITFNGHGTSSGNAGGDGAFIADGATLLLAAGGGGGSGFAGPYGGSGGTGGSAGQVGSAGGDGTVGGNPNTQGYGGLGATQSAGGTAGAYASTNGTGPGPGITTQGGTGGATSGAAYGGGGGGGYYGGGGGGSSGSGYSGGGGGGGGSSYAIGTATGVVYTTGANNGAPSLSISTSIAPGSVAFRLQTSGGNYYTSPSFTPSAFGSWQQFSFPLSAFTATGSPSWSTINTLYLITNANPENGAVTYKWNDLEVGAFGAFSNIQTVDCRALGWSKDRIYGAGIATGTTWQYYEVAASPKVWLTLPVGFTVPATSIQELGGFVYFGATKPSSSRIYAHDGTNVPFVAVQLPPGEQLTMIQPFLGAGLLVGCRYTSLMSGGSPGILYRAFPDSSGHLTLEKIAAFGYNDGNDYAPLCGTAQLDLVYFGMPNMGPAAVGEPGTNPPPGWSPNSGGLGVYNPATGGYARHHETTVAGHAQTIAACMYQGRHYFTVDGLGVFSEGSGYVPSGYITSSVYDWNIDNNKQLIAAELGTMPLPAGTRVSVNYSTNYGTFPQTWNSVIIDQAAGSTLARGTIYQQIQIAQYQAILYSDSSNLYTPTLKKAGLQAIFGIKPRRVFKVAVRAYDRMSLRNGQPVPGSGPMLSDNLEAALQTLRDSQQIVSFQPHGYGESNFLVIPVRVAGLRVLRQFQPMVGYANVIMTQLTEVPS